VDKALPCFFGNSSFFFLAQEKCTSGNGRTVLLSTMGPFCSSRSGNSAPIIPYKVAWLDIKSHIMDVGMAWDHTCNVVVIYPEQSYLTDQVSAYDGAQRYQASYSIDPDWRKVPGPGGLDAGRFEYPWAEYGEWNCGDACNFYTVEEMMVDDKPTLPRAFVGRSYRTGAVHVNITDSLQTRALSWNPFVAYTNANQFIGLGQCCSEAWCHPDCKGIKDENMVLFSYVPATGFSVLVDIGEFDAEAVHLGVEFSSAPAYNKPHQIYVFYQNTVITYDTVEHGSIIVQAKQSSQSPPLSLVLTMWANPGFF